MAHDLKVSLVRLVEGVGASVRGVKTLGATYLPTNVWQLPPTTEPTEDPDRTDPALRSLAPTTRRPTLGLRSAPWRGWTAGLWCSSARTAAGYPTRSTQPCRAKVVMALAITENSLTE